MPQIPPKPLRIGYLSPTSEPDVNVSSFRRGMHSLGYAEGSRYTIEVRYGHRDSARYPVLVDELLRHGIDVLVAGGPASRVAPLAGRKVPTVFVFSGDPIDAGIVSSLVKSEANVTGLALLQLEIAAKRIELLREAAPSIRRLAILSNPNHPGERSEFNATRQVAEALGIAVNYHEVRRDSEFEHAFSAIASQRCDSLTCFPEALSQFNRVAIADFALRHRLAAIFGWKSYAEAGGLLSYGPDLDWAYMRAAYFVHRIVTGSRPNDLPIEQPTKIELVLNQRTAIALDIRFPPSLLVRADQVIE